jgi:hypothetical protein
MSLRSFLYNLIFSSSEASPEFPTVDITRGNPLGVDCTIDAADQPVTQ